MIYHMVPTEVWKALASDADYAADTLSTEGFIHCTREPERLVWVANRFYRQDMRDYSILVIDPQRLHTELRWEEADGHLFPHVYGPINRDAICTIVPFLRDGNGHFLPSIFIPI